MNKTLTCVAVTTALLWLIVAGTEAQAGFRNIDNTPFNTVSNGPQGTVFVDVVNPNDSVAVTDAIRATFTSPRTRTSSEGRYARQLEFLRKAGRMRNDTRPAIDYTVILRSKGRVIGPPNRMPSPYASTTRPTRSSGQTMFGFQGIGLTGAIDTNDVNEVTRAGNEITFTYEGWTAQEQDELVRFKNIVYPVVKEIYGNPARNITVNVVRDPSISDRDALMGGIYVVSSEPRQMIIAGGQFGTRDNTRDFLRLMLRAFHDDLMFSYPAWEEGFIRAAAVVIGQRVDQALVNNGLLDLALMDDVYYYTLSTYDLLNQPALGNNTFTPESYTNPNFGGMLIPRLGMSCAAWLKVYTEYLYASAPAGQSFFKEFNGRYYAAVAGNSALPNSIPALKAIAAAITPEVEDSPFSEWYQQQYALDTSVSLGKKLFVWTQPQPSENPDTWGYTAWTFLIHYQTTQTGDELALNGNCYPVYWKWDYTQELYLGAQYEQALISNGECYIAPTFYLNQGGAQRVTMDFTVNNETARVQFPAGVTGTYQSPNSIYGVVLSSDGGSVTIDANAPVQSAGPITATRGVFSANLASPFADFLNQVTFTYTKGGLTASRKINMGSDGYVPVVEAEPSITTLSHTFPAGMSKVSFPLTTLHRDHSQALGIPANRLLLAHWQPDVTGEMKYEMYDPGFPRIAPIVPGRGYWMRILANTTVNITGAVADPSIPYRIGLMPGWNQIGSPLLHSIPVSSLLIEVGNDDPITLDQAAAQKVVASTVWGWDMARWQYVAATSLKPWEGYWIKCNSPTGAVLIAPAVVPYNN